MSKYADIIVDISHEKDTLTFVNRFVNEDGVNEIPYQLIHRIASACAVANEKSFKAICDQKSIRLPPFIFLAEFVLYEVCTPDKRLTFVAVLEANPVIFNSGELYIFFISAYPL